MMKAEGWEVNRHPEPELMNVCVDCPYCKREEWFVVLRCNQAQVVSCEDHRHGTFDYILEYKVAVKV